jgi:glyoxalase superfamily protein
MPYDFQIVVDAARPHDLADWWAETLGWAVEPSDEAFIRRMIAEGQATEADTTTHRGTLVWAVGAAIRHPDAPAKGHPHGPGQRVLFQVVPEGKTVKNRLHLDVWVGADDRPAVVDRLTARGATRLWEGHEGPSSWVTMADPEGNEFCVV